MDKSSIADRMKNNYENRTRVLLPRRTNTIIRLDGKVFHTYTKNAQRPFDTGLMLAMQDTTKFLCKNIQGVRFAYTQSDEISLWLTDWADTKTDAWFDGNIQKITSVSASYATAYFNSIYKNYVGSKELAYFDSRVFTIPEIDEVFNYFIWRQQDATRNSIQMVGQSLYSQKELHGKSINQVQELIFQKGQNWNDRCAYEKRGSVVKRINGDWQVVEPPIFTQERIFLLN